MLLNHLLIGILVITTTTTTIIGSLEVKQQNNNNNDVDFLTDLLKFSETHSPSASLVQDESKERRNYEELEDTLHGYDETKSDSALIVIDTEQEPSIGDVTKTEPLVAKRSSVAKQHDNGEGDEDFDRGFTIIIDREDLQEDSEQKDQIYQEMEKSYGQVQQKFKEEIQQPVKEKHVRVIVITPQDQDASTKSSSSPESHQNPQQQHTQNELDLDIDKLQKVRDKMTKLDVPTPAPTAAAEDSTTDGDKNASTFLTPPDTNNNTRTASLSIGKAKLGAEKNNINIDQNKTVDTKANSKNSKKAGKSVTINYSKEFKMRNSYQNKHTQQHGHQEPESEFPVPVIKPGNEKQTSVKKQQQQQQQHHVTSSQPPKNPQPKQNFIEEHYKLKSLHSKTGEKKSTSAQYNKQDSTKNNKKNKDEDDDLITSRPKIPNDFMIGTNSTVDEPSSQPEDINQMTNIMAEEEKASSKNKTKNNNKNNNNNNNNNPAAAIDSQQQKQAKTPSNEKTTPTTTPPPVKEKEKKQPQKPSTQNKTSFTNDDSKTQQASPATQPQQPKVDQVKSQKSKQNDNQKILSNNNQIKNGNNMTVGEPPPPPVASTTSNNKADPKQPLPINNNKVIKTEKAEAIIQYLNKDPLESWRYPYGTLKALDLDASLIRSGLVFPGYIDRLKGIMKRAISGQDIMLSIVGGSISAGGGLYKDHGSIEGLYYKGVVDWWNQWIFPVTGSKMKVNNAAVGSIGTDYFSYCVKNHLKPKPDLIIWELSGNDYNRYKTFPTKGARPLERFTRMILDLPSKPALLYLNFFKGIDYKNSRTDCPNFEDQQEHTIASYYHVPTLSWRAMVCKGLVDSKVGFLMSDLFSIDQYHPSLKGHAQSALLILLHLRHVMRAVLQYAIKNNGQIADFEDMYKMPDPLFIGPKHPEPFCWTLIRPDERDPVHNTLEVSVASNDGFKIQYATNFPIRFDKVMCYKSEKTDSPTSSLRLVFTIPRTEDNKDKRFEVAITTHSKWGGSAMMWIDDKNDEPVFIQEGRPGDPGRRTQVDTVANGLTTGTHFLNLWSKDGGFCLAAIMIDST